MHEKINKKKKQKKVENGLILKLFKLKNMKESVRQVASDILRRGGLN